MAISLAVAFIGSVVAAAGTGVLTVRCFRAPRADVIFMALALLGLTVALGAQTLGNLAGFGPTTFRAMELGGQVLAPIALCLGMAEMAAQRVLVRFAARLILSALAVVEFVILSADQLNPAATFSKAWPAASVYYETIPKDLLEFGIAFVTALAALTTIGVAAVRLGRDRAWRPAAMATGSAAVATLALAVPAAVTLPSGAVFAVFCLAAAALTWLAGTLGGNLRGDLLNGRFTDQDNDGWDSEDSWAGRIDQTGNFDGAARGGEGLYRGNGLYRPEDGDSASGYRQRDDGYDRDGREAGYISDGYGREEVGAAYDGEYADDYESGDADANYAANGRGHPVPDARYEEYGDDADRSGASGNGSGGAARSGIWRSADRPGEADHSAAAGIPVGDDEARARLFGQIAIYTLLEDRVGEFDLLTEHVVEQVRAREPDTLVYIVHAVPSAPMQRILYEVYRDRAAYDEHRRQPYVERFELERRPYVLATNVIELGLKQAKVSPLPSISDLLGPSGPGTPGFIPPAAGRQAGSGQAGSGQLGSGQAGSGQLGSGQAGSAQLGSGQQGSGQLGRGQPGRGISGYDELGIGLSGYDVPERGLPGYDEPGNGLSGHDKPSRGLSGYDQPGHGEPGYSPSGSSPSGSSPSGYDEPPYEEPSYAEPEYVGPRYAEPGYSPSGYSPSGYDEPRHDQPGYDEPRHDQAGYDQTSYDAEAPYEEAPYAEPRYGERGYGQRGYDKSQPGDSTGREEDPQRQW